MGTMLVLVPFILTQHLREVALAGHQEPVKALAPHAAHPALHDRVHSGHPDTVLDDLQPGNIQAGVRYPPALPSIRPAARHFLTRKQVILMSTGIIVVIVVAVIVVAALVTGVMAIMRRRRLQQRFGPEYPALPYSRP
jgi:hypothetical protein